MAGFFLVLALLVLGGAIATIGDRLGSKVGKARLSLFRLRPRDTAVLVTIFTGVMIAGVSLGLILLVSDQIRVGLFELDQLQNNLAQARAQKEKAEQELKMALTARRQAEQNLFEVNRKLIAAREKTQQELDKALEARQQAERKLSDINRRLTLTVEQQQRVERQLSTVRSNFGKTKAQVKTLQTQKQALQKDAVALKDEQRRLIATLEASRTEIRTQKIQKYLLAAEVNDYETALRKSTESLLFGDVIYRASDILATFRVLGGMSPEQIRRNLDAVLGQLEVAAKEAGARPSIQGENAVQIPREQVTRLIRELSGPDDHALQLIAATNSLRGGPVLVSGQVFKNELIFKQGEIVTSRAIDLGQDEEGLAAQFSKLFTQANERALAAEILPSGRNLRDPNPKVGSFSADALQQMIKDLKNQSIEGPVTVQALASEDIYKIGPLKLTLVALQNGKVVSKAGQ